MIVYEFPFSPGRRSGTYHRKNGDENESKRSRTKFTNFARLQRVRRFRYIFLVPGYTNFTKRFDRAIMLRTRSNNSERSYRVSHTPPVRIYKFYLVPVVFDKFVRRHPRDFRPATAPRYVPGTPDSGHCETVARATVND